jgi:hypothetical protein
MLSILLIVGLSISISSIIIIDLRELVVLRVSNTCVCKEPRQDALMIKFIVILPVQIATEPLNVPFQYQV